MAFSEKTLNVKTIFEGKIINVHVDGVELSDGKKSFREVVEHSGGVCVAPLTDDDELLMVRQFRYPFYRELLEVPAGKLEKGEDPLAAGIRELEEECGVVADKIVSLGEIYPTVAYCSEIIYMFAAKGLNKTHQHLDEGEFLGIEKIKFNEALAMVMDGKIRDAKTVTAILKIARLKQDGVL
ncbi:MAG: NUDIX hydrolase [Clostridia bacterium]|nr:NUDIX hydrolase [Clostridia bacterium]